MCDARAKLLFCLLNVFFSVLLLLLLVVVVVFFSYILVAVASLNLMLLQNKRKWLHLTLVLMVIGKAKGCSQRFFSLRSVASSLKKPLIVEKQNVSLQSTMIYIFFNLHLLTDFCVLDQVSICWKSCILEYEICRNKTEELHNTLVIFKMISSVC